MKNKNPETEQESLYKDLDQMSVKELLTNINTEDQKVPQIIQGQIPKIEKLDLNLNMMKFSSHLATLE